MGLSGTEEPRIWGTSGSKRPGAQRGFTLALWMALPTAAWRLKNAISCSRKKQERVKEAGKRNEEGVRSEGKGRRSDGAMEGRGRAEQAGNEGLTHPKPSTYPASRTASHGGLWKPGLGDGCLCSLVFSSCRLLTPLHVSPHPSILPCKGACWPRKLLLS